MKESNPTIIIQARMGSTRLPSKCTLQLYKDETLLDHLLDRINKGCEHTYNLLVGTPPDMISQKPIHDICRKHNVQVFIGSEDDLLSRYYYGAKKYNADPIIRITSDCPLLDPSLIDEAYAYYNSFFTEYFSNAPEGAHTPGYPSGFNVEVISFKLLEHLHQVVTEPELREHCTKALTKNKYSEKLLVGLVRLGLPDESRSRHKFSVDTKEDLEFVRKIVKELYPRKKLYTYEEVLQCIKMKDLSNEPKREKK